MQNNFDDFRGNRRSSNSQGPGNRGKDRDNNKFQNLGKGLSGTFSFEELTGDSKTRPNTPKKKRNSKKERSRSVGRPVKFEKPSALMKADEAKEQSKEQSKEQKEQSRKNKGLFGSILSMFHGDDMKERKMTVSSRNTVEEIKEQLERLYDRVKEYESKLDDKSKEISSKLVELSKKTSKLSREINKSQSRIDMFKKRVRGYETDFEKIKNEDDVMKQTLIDGKIKELNFKIQEEQKKIMGFKSELQPLAKQKSSLENKKSEIKKSLADLKKKSVAIDQKLGRHTVSKESTFEILRRSIKENARRREIEPSQVSAGDLSFRATFNSKTYNMEYQKTKGGIPGFSGLKIQNGPRFNWIEQRLKRAEQNGFSTTPPDERENNKEPGGKDNPDR